MRISQQLFEGEHIYFAPIDHEKDAEVESRWTHDAEYLRLLSSEPAMPLSVAKVKKCYEAIEKQVEEDKNQFYFTIRMRSDERLIGFARLYWIGWSNGTGAVQIGIGEATDRLHGYGSEALRLLIRFAFHELNLYRLTAYIAAYNAVALHMFTKAGFTQEVCRRQAINRDGQRWDMLHLGILREDWEQAEQA
jgi:RimJ/RimL family protein N-acetyltransferase